jgi:c(7)-type cytochrome triheme protein
MMKTILLAIFFTLVIATSLSFAKLGDMRFDYKAASRKKAGVAPVVFPHGKHEDIYKCADCHPKIFKDKRGANDVSMQKNIDGEFCGSAECHNSSKAFPLYQCNKCHTGKP